MAHPRAAVATYLRLIASLRRKAPCVISARRPTGNNYSVVVEQQHQALEVAQGQRPVVLIDDIGVLQNLDAAEEGLMSIYQTLRSGWRNAGESQYLCLGLEFALADLNFRMRGFEHFALVPLNDQDKAQVLTERAHAKGYELTDTVLDYWLRRGPRDLSTLVADLQRLDQATFEHQRLLTVPLLKEVLGY